MKTLLLIWSLAIGQCLAGPTFFGGQQGVLATTSSTGYVPSDHGAAVIKWWIAARKESYSNNDSVGIITDWSTSGINATQSTSSKKPVFKTNVQNGQSAILADGADDDVTLASNPLSGATTVTAILVVRSISDPPAFAQGPPLGNWGTAASSSHFPYSDGNIYDGTFVSARVIVVNPATTLAQFNVVTWIFNGSTLVMRVNGTQIASSAATLSLGSAPKIFSMTAAGNYFLNGYIAECVMWNGNLSGTDLTTEENGLKVQYATP